MSHTNKNGEKVYGNPHITVRVPAAVRAGLKKEAKRQRVTLTQLVLPALEKLAGVQGDTHG